MTTDTDLTWLRHGPVPPWIFISLAVALVTQWGVMLAVALLG